MNNKPATSVLQEALFSSLCEAIEAFKKNSGGMPNALVRDLGALHPNTSFTDIPEGVQQAIRDSVQDTLKRLQKDGYIVAPKNPIRTVRHDAPKSDPAYRRRNPR